MTGKSNPKYSGTNRRTAHFHNDPFTVREIRKLRKHGCPCCGRGFTLRELAIKYEVHQTCIDNLVNRRTYKNVE